ncbi:YodC family protein [Pseudomonas siliginis]|uniref:YodC family protein n=1 Tax=Pseudomonas siliginis TaxID=2842346 RepID=UPI000F04CA21|nr:DUF2158 domain-containing protein [Pseudomonas siliginis]UST97762.1 DUF2158 domain-containing protein [Pseudomonas siliginis]
MSDIQKGDVVQLKSGGPQMTVQGVDDYSPTGPEEGAHCVWFEKNKREDSVFDVCLLEKTS